MARMKASHPYNNYRSRKSSCLRIPILSYTLFLLALLFPSPSFSPTAWPGSLCRTFTDIVVSPTQEFLSINPPQRHQSKESRSCTGQENSGILVSAATGESPGYDHDESVEDPVIKNESIIEDNDKNDHHNHNHNDEDDGNVIGSKSQSTSTSSPSQHGPGVTNERKSSESLEEGKDTATNKKIEDNANENENDNENKNYQQKSQSQSKTDEGNNNNNNNNNTNTDTNANTSTRETQRNNIENEIPKKKTTEARETGEKKRAANTRQNNVTNEPPTLEPTIRSSTSTSTSSSSSSSSTTTKASSTSSSKRNGKSDGRTERTKSQTSQSRASSTKNPLSSTSTPNTRPSLKSQGQRANDTAAYLRHERDHKMRNASTYTQSSGKNFTQTQTHANVHANAHANAHGRIYVDDEMEREREEARKREAEREAAAAAAAAAEARRQKKIRDRERQSESVTKTILKAASSERCNWMTNPLSVIKGEVCGSHYKILGLDRRKSSLLDKSDFKKAYRTLSLSVHPDKNRSPGANEAFKLMTEAYECLSDNACREDYDAKLRSEEDLISYKRKQLKERITITSLEVLAQGHYYASVAANYIYQAGLDIWQLAGEWEVDIFGEARPIGRILLSVAMFFKGRVLLQLHAISYLIVRCNYELAKRRGLF